jgi:hypothetical protein
VRTLEDFYRRGREDGGTFEIGLDLALRRLLAGPKFLVRVERDPTAGAPGSAYTLSDLELASRLSFFLWSSIPDDELLGLAEGGRLRGPAVLAGQVRRMLADAKSQAFIDNFGGQWLQLRNLRNKQPNSHEFPDFDDNLRRYLQTETELFFASIVREDRSILELMTADYTFLNERLAKHYGIHNVYGTHFRRVVLQDDARRGLLGKGAILMVTSHAHRTSPVLRGKWILENVLGAPPPPPPDVVPPFEEITEAGRPKSVRERMEQHRRNPACASCHRMIDPAGLALENFDAGRRHAGDARGRLWTAGGRHSDQRGDRAAAGPSQGSTGICAHDDGAHHDLRPRQGPHGVGYASRSRSCAGGGRRRVSFLVGRSGRGAKRAVPDAREGPGQRRLGDTGGGTLRVLTGP